MNGFDLCGYIGSTTLSFMLIPQVYHSYKIKNVDGLSFIYLCMQLFTSLILNVYAIGIFKSTDFFTTLPMFISNSSISVMTVVLIFMKAKFKKQVLDRVYDQEHIQEREIEVI